MKINNPNDIFDHPLISKRYFFPRKASLKNPYLIESQGNTLACYYHKTEGASHTIIHFHGNAEVCADYINSPLNTLPCNILYAEYAGFGASSKAIPKLLSMLKDIDAIVGSLDTPEDKLIFFGRSVGSIYAVNATACYPNAAGLIIESGIADVLERILLRVFPDEIDQTFHDMKRYARLYFDHMKKLKNYRGKTLIMHTEKDTVVDVKHARRLYLMANNPKNLHIFENGDHNTILYENKKEYLKILNAFLSDIPSNIN